MEGTKQNSRTVLITGATSGIGYEFAKIFHREGYNLVLTGRDKEVLKKLDKELGSVSIALDLSKSGSVSELYEFTKKKNLDVEILVNNAGFGSFGEFIAQDNADAMVQVNIASLTTLTQLYGRDMAKKGHGKILNIASVAAYFPGPYASVYYASKAYVLSFSEGLREELKKKGVQVCVLCPGATKTKFFVRAGINNSRLEMMGTMDAAKVAEIGYSGLMKDKGVIIPGFTNFVFVGLARHMPRFVLRKLMASLQK
ncbi:MAG: SDR family oxidoreductase [Nanoarchaeota archaeon]|nr:SDR family oxidoreductase [Nanoarchaeota archaeon]